MKMPKIDKGAGFLVFGADEAKFSLSRQLLASLLAFALMFAVVPLSARAQQDSQQDSQQQQSGSGQGQAYTQQTPEQLQQLVAPIALYPDSLVAQILAATTFPAEVVEADRWVQDHPDLKGDALAQAVDQQPWDPSVKALTGFPTVLGNMDKNISWTSSLGDAYYNQQQDVMDAIQVMRQKAQQAGNLKSTDQQTVQNEGSTVVIQPANPEIVYVPAYDPWIVYGPPIVAWPGWYPYPGIWWGGPGFSFGVGFGIGWYGGYGWGWNHWRSDWHRHEVVYNHNTYISNSRTFYNRNVYYSHGGDRGVTANPRNSFGNQGRNEAERNAANRNEANRNEANRNQANRENTRAPGNVYDRPGESSRPFEGNKNESRGWGETQQRETRSSGFSGYDHGGESRSYSSRGASSFGGGGYRGGGGGGGGRGGGGHR
jgi:hypothetical protein